MTLGIVLLCSLASSLGDLLENTGNLQLNASQADQSLNIQSNCSMVTVQKLKAKQGSTHELWAQWPLYKFF